MPSLDRQGLLDILQHRVAILNGVVLMNMPYDYILANYWYDKEKETAELF